jgi:hypothetical protein
MLPRSGCAPAFAWIVVLTATPPPLAAQSVSGTTVSARAPELATRVRRYGGWVVAETPSFWVCCYSDELPAADIGRHCEALRSQLCAKWLGDKAPTTWSPKCSVVLHPNRESYLAAVGRQAASTAGSSLVERHSGGIGARRIDLRSDRADYLTAALPHELTHVVIADRLAGRSLPRWADEGMAILADSEDKRALHFRDLRSGWARGEVFSMEQLLPLRDYPSPESWGVFYGQSTSVVQYLVERATPQRFVEFLQHAAIEGYDRALQKSYGIGSVEELDRLWRLSLLGSSPDWLGHRDAGRIANPLP